MTELKRIGDIVNFKRGYDLPAYARVDGEYPVMSSSGVSGYHNEFKIEGEGLVTGRYGTLGEFYYVNGKYWPHNTALYVTDFKGNYPKYVYFLMKSLSFLKRSDKSTVPGIDRKDLHEIKIPYIKGEQQKLIADALFLIEEKIALNNDINTELENLAKTIYNYWFVQFDFPNEEGKPYKTSGGEMVWNEELKREIPKGWEVFLLKEKLEFERGVEPGSDKYFEKQIDETLIPFFKVGGMNGDTDVWIKNDEANGAICREEDILLSLDGSVGRIAIGLSGAYSSGIRKVYPKNGNFPKSYIYFLLHSDEIQQTIKKNATGSNILHAAKALDYMMAPYNANVVESFDKLCNPIFNKILATKRENQELIKLRDFLLPLLMNGQVKVKSEATEQLSMAAEPQVKYGK
ncbi:type I restriction endonuclease subunit S [Schleiferia thermophila str. Yellowstone]|nr:type I restriction endonuclease subunit S [Schleiferia thermophila str. Yellowstone]